jgi:ankyrin repeat protein
MERTINLNESIRIGDLEGVRAVLQQYPEAVKQKDQRSFPPLIMATYYDQIEITAYLIQSGADLDAQDASGNTALMGVCFKGFPEIAKMLINSGADPNIRNYNGATALHFASTFGQKELVKLLLEKGADKNATDSRGNTALAHARMQGLKEIEEMLA